MAYFQILNDRNGQYYARLRSNNHENICWTESYKAKANAQKAINFIKINAGSAPVRDLTL